MRNERVRFCALLSAAIFAAAGRGAMGVEIDGVQPAALDQPQINMIFSGDDGTVKSMTGLGIDPNGDLSDNVTTFTVTAYLDTGSGSILLSQDTATGFGVGLDGATLTDVGVGGPAAFAASENLHISFANNYPRTDLDQLDSNNQPVTTPYVPVAPAAGNTGLHAEVGPLSPPSDDDLTSILAGLNSVDIGGMPLMVGKVVVIDPKPTNGLIDVINGLGDPNADFDQLVTELENSETRTYIYNPGEGFHSDTQDTNPGIPTTNLHVKLSYASFARFTPSTGGVGPDIAHNPFIGPNPVAAFDHQPTDNTPGIKISRTITGPTGNKTLTSEGSWLLDTGAAANFISQAQAAALGVHYKAGTYQTDAPDLVDDQGNDIGEQFTLSIGGIGDTQVLAGFWLDSMLIRTMEGSATDDNNPYNLVFRHVPVLVSDISVTDPLTGKVLTLDGDFAMNNLLASANFDSDPNDLFPISDPSTTPFNWVVFDEPNGVLGLDVDHDLLAAAVGNAVPEPGTLMVMGIGAMALMRRRR